MGLWHSVSCNGVSQCQLSTTRTSCCTRMISLYGARKWIQARTVHPTTTCTFLYIKLPVVSGTQCIYTRYLKCEYPEFLCCRSYLSPQSVCYRSRRTHLQQDTTVAQNASGCTEPPSVPRSIFVQYAHLKHMKLELFKFF